MATTIGRAVKAKTAKSVKPKKVDLSAYPAVDVKFAQDYVEWIKYVFKQARNVRRGLPSRTKLTVPTTKTVCEELAALRREYGDVTASVGSTSFSIITTSKPVVLHDSKLGNIALGQFKLSAGLGYDSRYRDIHLNPKAYPMTPHYPKADLSHRYPHPHVEVDHLCTGSGYTAILTGLKFGRLYDAVMAMHSVIHHHEDMSAYWALSDWGVTGVCFNCDATKANNAKCHVCRSVFCRHCSCKCFCGRIVCNGCMRGHNDRCPFCNS